MNVCFSLSVSVEKNAFEIALNVRMLVFDENVVQIIFKDSFVGNSGNFKFHFKACDSYDQSTTYTCKWNEFPFISTYHMQDYTDFASIFSIR